MLMDGTARMVQAIIEPTMSITVEKPPLLIYRSERGSGRAPPPRKFWRRSHIRA